MNKKIVVALLATASVALVLFFAMYEKPITAEEQALLVTPAELQPYLLFDAPTGGTFTAKRSWNGAAEFRYELQDKRLLLISEAERFPAESLAKKGFRTRVKAYSSGMREMTPGAAFVDAPELFAGGDENYASYIQHRDRKLGNIIVTRRGSTVFALVLTGVFIGDKETLAGILGPKLERAK